MLDENTLVVTYQAWRGEKRGHGRRTPETKGVLGDCIDCAACVHACPTGIDIRDGIQLECIGCGLCVDACNGVMAKSGGTPWLITWDTLARQQSHARGETPPPVRFLRTRTLVYAAILVVVAGAMVAALLGRSRLDLTVIHDRAPLYVRLADGDLRNGYTVKLANKTETPKTFTLRVESDPPLRITDPETGGAPAETLSLAVGADTVGTFRVVAQGHAAGGERPVTFIVQDAANGREKTYESVFLGPRAP
jgi:cytochrome c oxidase accessory protein FixG